MPKLTVGHESDTPIELHYDDLGSGDPVVLIHGWPLSSRSWEGQVPALIEAGHRVVTYDRRGFGQSSQPWSGYDYETFTADLQALLEHLDLRAVTLVGFSMGGGEVARYLAIHGAGRVARAVFIAAVPPFLHLVDDNPDGGLDDATLQSLLDGVREDRPAFVDDFLKSFFSANGELQVSEAQRRYARSMAWAASPKGTLDCITAFATTDFRDDLAKIDVPTLVIHGDADATVPFEASGRRTAEAVTGAQLHVIKGGPHGVTASHAKELNQVLLAFLAT